MTFDRNFFRNFIFTFGLLFGYFIQLSLSGTFSKLVRSGKQLELLCTQFQVNIDGLIAEAQESTGISMQLNILMIIFSASYITSENTSKKFRILIIVINILCSFFGFLIPRIS